MQNLIRVLTDINSARAICMCTLSGMAFRPFHHSDNGIYSFPYGTQSNRSNCYNSHFERKNRKINEFLAPCLWLCLGYNIFIFFKCHSQIHIQNVTAEFLTTISRHMEACEQRVRAAELSPNEYSLVVSAATALRLLDRKIEAEKWYRLVSTIFILLCGVQCICTL